MIKLDSGEEFELHKHIVKFDDNTKEIIVDAASETFWIDVCSIPNFRIHRKGEKSLKSIH